MKALQLIELCNENLTCISCDYENECNIFVEEYHERPCSKYIIYDVLENEIELK